MALSRRKLPFSPIDKMLHNSDAGITLKKDLTKPVCFAITTMKIISLLRLIAFGACSVLVSSQLPAADLARVSINDDWRFIKGPGEIIATDNRDGTDLTSFQAADCKAFNGLALAIVKAKRGQRGTITVTATSEGLKSASTTIKLN